MASSNKEKFEFDFNGMSVEGLDRFLAASRDGDLSKVSHVIAENTKSWPFDGEIGPDGVDNLFPHEFVELSGAFQAALLTVLEGEGVSGDLDYSLDISDWRMKQYGAYTKAVSSREFVNVALLLDDYTDTDHSLVDAPLPEFVLVLKEVNQIVSKNFRAGK